MPDRKQSPTDELRALALSLRALEGRVRRLETRVDGGQADPATDESPPIAAVVAAEQDTPVAAVAGFGRAAPLAGRLLLVLGGAFVLRALTESKTVPQAAGVGLGLVYALLWLLPSVRAGRRGDALGSGIYAAASALIAYPLVWETTTLFKIMSPAVTALTLGGLGLLGLGLAWRFRVVAIAWTASIGASLCVLALVLPRTPAMAHLTVTLLVLGLVALWVGRLHEWSGPIWFSALALDATLAVLIADTLEADGLAVGHATAVAILAAAFCTYVGSMTAYLLAGWRRLDGLDLTQTVLLLGVAFGGAIGVAGTTTTAPEALGLASLGVAVAFYIVAFRVLDRERRRTFYYVTTVALVLVVVGSAVLLTRPAVPWALLAIAAVLLARRFGRGTLGLHGAVYAVAASAASGLLAQGASAFLAAASNAWPAPAPESYLALAAAAFCAVVPTRSDTGLWTRFVVVPQAVLLAVVAWGLGAVALDLLARLLPRGAEGGLDAAWLASLRTAVLGGLTLLCAWVGRVPRFEPARWFVVPLLVAGALKLALQDLPQGHPASWALSFVVFGAVLIAAPRLARARAEPVGEHT